MAGSKKKKIDFGSLYAKVKHETETQDAERMFYVESQNSPYPFSYARAGLFSHNIPEDSPQKTVLSKKDNGVCKNTFHEQPSSVDLKDTEEMKTIKEHDDYKSISDVVGRDCGEPLEPQLLRLDFTPIEGVDHDRFTLNKCMAFWKLIDDHPELNLLKVDPEVKDSTDDSLVTTCTCSTPSSYTTIAPDEASGLTPLAIQALPWLQKEDLMNNSLATKIVARPCEPRDYIEYRQKNKADNWPSGTKLHHEKVLKIPYLASSSIHKSQSKQSKTQIDELAHMMAEMHKFDQEHPKCMEFTENPECLLSVKTDRKRSILPYIDTNDDKYCEKCLN